MPTKREILSLIALGETRKAIDALLETTLLFGEDLHREATLQSARYEQFKRDERSGVQSRENLDIAVSRINAALVEIAHKLPEEKAAKIDLPAPRDPWTNTRARTRLRFALQLLVIVSAIGIGWIVFQQFDAAEKNGALEDGRDTIVLIEDGAPPVDQAAAVGKPATARRKERPVEASDSSTASPGRSQIDVSSPSDSLSQASPSPDYKRKLETVEGMTRIVAEDGRQSFLKMDGQWIGEWYEDVENFLDGEAYVKKNGRRFWIDKTGKCIRGCE